jgi:urease accessory protein
MTGQPTEQHSIENEIAELEQRLQQAKLKLSNASTAPRNGHDSGQDATAAPAIAKLPALHRRDNDDDDHDISNLHTLLLLADSALPLGSFAFSSGLESFLAHRRLAGSPRAPPLDLFRAFVDLSLQSVASTALPYVAAAHRCPRRLAELDNDFDASTPCTVARRASIAQGRALVTVWERSYRGQFAEGRRAGDEMVVDNANSGGNSNSNEGNEAAVVAAAAADVLAAFSTALRAHPPPPSSATETAAYAAANGHLAPVWGVVTRLLDMPLRSAAYVFLFSHVRAVVSAAVRASVLGPYQAQSELARADLSARIRALVERYWDTPVEEAGQTVPALDLWVGRHEKLYSRIFNS